MKSYPALDVVAEDIELLYSVLDDFSPTAIEERAGGLRAFFLTSSDRDAAHQALTRYAASPIDVPDDDWARRSQEGLESVTVGRITVHPTAANPQQDSLTNPTIPPRRTNPVNPLHPANPVPPNPSNPQPPIPNHLVIAPSMGFGTGHHATTRLCLTALQTMDLGGKFVLDVGTGSGVLAIAARALGAAEAYGIDFDPDAIASARENLTLNPSITNVSFAVADLNCLGSDPRQARLGSDPRQLETRQLAADIVMANLTGALLVRAATTLIAATRPGGVLILSGLMRDERDDVVRAFGAGEAVWERAEDEWIGLVVKKP